MNIHGYVCNYIRSKIPPQILQRFMMPVQYGNVRQNHFIPADVNNYIIEKVIFGRVVPEIGLLDGGAHEIVIPTAGCNIEWIDKDKYVIHVPKEKTNGRSIVSALALIWYGVENIGGPQSLMAMGNNITGMNTQCGANGMMNQIAAIAKPYQPLPFTQTSNVRIVAEDTVLVEELFGPIQQSYLRVMLSHDKELTSISPSAWRYFGELCTYATKAYIYNNFIIDIDMAELVGGQELGRIKDIVDSYSDAEELYQNYLDEKWRKIQFMADDARHRRFLKALIGRYK